MTQPCDGDIRKFLREFLPKEVLVTNPKPSVNALTKFKEYLRSQEFSGIICEEFAEKNSSNLVNQIITWCEEWTLLGLNKPLHLMNQKGGMITWAHPKFEQLSGYSPLDQQYCSILKWVREANERQLLGYAALFLYSLGFTKIFITDTSGDGGIDLVGSCADSRLLNLCFFIQCKTTNDNKQLDKGILLSDYSKYLLLRKISKWNQYLKSLGVEHSISGMSSVFCFVSNSEFKPGFREAAVHLEVLIRSSRQIAASISKLGDIQQIEKALISMSPFDASTSNNLYKTIHQHFKS